MFQGEMVAGYTRRSSSGAMEKTGAGPWLQRGKKGAARAHSQGARKGGATTGDRSWNASSRLKKRKGEKESAQADETAAAAGHDGVKDTARNVGARHSVAGAGARTGREWTRRGRTAPWLGSARDTMVERK